MSEIVFSPAQPVEKVSIVILLTECGLSIREMNSPNTRFIVAKQDGRIIGSAGLEKCGKYGLLHSIAVKRDFRGNGLGKTLYEKMTELAQGEGTEEFYVLTRAAEGLFAKWGFAKTERDQVPAEIRDTNDFKNDIFSNYVCMTKKLEPKAAPAAEPATAPAAAAAPVDVETAVASILQKMTPAAAPAAAAPIDKSKVQYYPASSLPLLEDIPGARVWGVGVDKVMLAYLEMAPETRLTAHAHEYEQVTMVLEGELLVEVDGNTHTVKAGEVIAVPAGESHAFATGDLSVKAIDAWSPIPGKYRK